MRTGTLLIAIGCDLCDTGDPVRVLDSTEAAAAAASDLDSTASHLVEFSDGDDANDSLQLHLVEAIQACDGLATICALNTGTLRLAAVRLDGDGSVTLGGLELSMLEPRAWMVFISHAQLEAQNQCALLVRLLAEAGVDVRQLPRWFLQLLAR